MLLLRNIAAGIRFLFQKKRADRELDEELRGFMEMAAEEGMKQGRSQEDAVRAVRLERGSVEAAKELVRSAGWESLLEMFWQDVCYGLRMLRKSPGFTAIAILTLALGIGANTAIFSVVDGVLLHSLPYLHSERIVLLAETVGSEHNPVSYPNFLDWQRENNVFQNLAAYAQSEVNLNNGGNSEHVSCEVVSSGYFELLGVHPILGARFAQTDNFVPSGQPSILLGYGIWKRQFGGNPAVIGRSIQMNGSEFTIAGVLPRGFRGFSGQADIWAPLQTRDTLWPESAQYKLLQSRDIHWHRVIARLKQGVTLAQAQAEMSAIGTHLAETYPEANRGRGVVVLPAKRAVIGDLRTLLLVLLGAVGCVLLIACANIANLFLVRAIARRREIAIRVSLGAGRGRLIQQLLTESLLIATAGGICGVLLAFWAIKILPVNLPIALPYYAKIKINLVVLAFTAFVTGMAGLLLGSLPAWKASRPNLAESIKKAAYSSAGKREGNIGGALVVFETATVLLLMIGAGLLLRSFERMSQIDPGFRPDHLLTLRVHIPNHGYTAQQRALLGERLVEKVESLPGVASAAANTADLFKWDGISRAYTIEGRAPVPTSETDTVYYHEVTPGFFKTMDVPLYSGRDFTLLDDMRAPRSIIVSRSFAQRYWPHENPIGKRLKLGLADSTLPWMNVIGVVGDYRYHKYLLNPDNTPVFYGALAQNPNVGEISLLVRTKTNPAAMTGPLRRAIENIDPNIPVYSVATLETRLADQFQQTRASAGLLTLFALLALVLGAIGLYGVMSHTVTQQIREIGIRMALGAQRKDVLRMVLAKGLRLTGLGIACGFLASLALTRLMQAMLFGVTPTDTETIGIVVSLLMLIAVAACYIPARRAMRVDPIVALRYE